MCARQNTRNFFIKRGKHLELTRSYLENKINTFKNITGTSISSIIGDDKYKTPFQMWCEIVGIYKAPEIDKIYKEAPKFLEAKIRDFVSKDKSINFCSYDYNDNRGNIFQSESLIFGGLPDGEPVDKMGQLDYSNNKPMLEIKTVSIDQFDGYYDEEGKWKVKLSENGAPVIKAHGVKKLSWMDSYGNIKIPKEDLKYLDQLQLYLYLRGQKNGLFAVCFLETEDYVNYEQLDVAERDIKYKEIVLSADFEEKVHKCEEWYKNYVLKGVSPEMTDKDILWAINKGLID